MSNAGAHLVDAATYARWATFWPGASGPFAKPMNEIRKVVFSNSLGSVDWSETTIATGDLAEPSRGSTRSVPADTCWGWARRGPRSLVATRLIDEYRLVVQPVVLGEGARHFDTPLTIWQISTTALSRGAVAHVFAAHP